MIAIAWQCSQNDFFSTVSAISERFSSQNFAIIASMSFAALPSQ